MAKRHVSPVGEIVFGAIVEPRENQITGTLEYSLGFQLPMDQSDGMLSALEEALTEARNKDPKFKAKGASVNLPYKPAARRNPETDELEPIEGMLLWTFKRKDSYVRKATGEVKKNTPPQLYDSNGYLLKPGELIDVPRGSTGRVVFEPYAYSIGSFGVQFQLVGFQIATLAENDLGVKLEKIEGGFVSGQQVDEEFDQLIQGA